MAGILVYALHDDEGNFNKNSLGAISEAAKLAGEIGGEASALVVGDVADDGALAFNRSDDLTFGGAVSGSGSVTACCPRPAAGRPPPRATGTSPAKDDPPDAAHR